MSTTVESSELETAIAGAELTDEEASRVRELVQEGGIAASAIAFVVSQREEPEDDEPAPPPPEPVAGEPSKTQLKQLDAELVRHEKRVHEVMGPFVAGFVPCDGCGGVGLVAPGPPPPRPQTHEWFKPCVTCAGFGEVLTGSHRDGYTSRDCPACRGRGYLEALDESGGSLAPQESAVAAGTPPAPPPSSNGETATTVAPASFGTPTWMGNPNLGA